MYGKRPQRFCLTVAEIHKRLSVDRISKKLDNDKNLVSTGTTTTTTTMAAVDVREEIERFKAQGNAFFKEVRPMLRRTMQWNLFSASWSVSQFHPLFDSPSVFLRPAIFALWFSFCVSVDFAAQSQGSMKPSYRTRKLLTNGDLLLWIRT